MPGCCIKKKKKKAGKLVHIACFRLVPSPRATVAASWCGFHYLSSIYWTILKPTPSRAAILAAAQRREQQQRKWKRRSCSLTAHSVWTESLFAQLDIHENAGFIKVWCSHLAILSTTCMQLGVNTLLFIYCYLSIYCYFIYCFIVDRELSSITQRAVVRLNSAAHMVSNIINSSLPQLTYNMGCTWDYSPARAKQWLMYLRFELNLP